VIRGRSSSLLGLVVTAIVAVPSAAFVMQRTLSNPTEHRMELTASEGALAITNSREGQAILTAVPMVPGTSTTGSVNLVNSGEANETLTLDAGAPVDTPGPGGGLLSERLRLRVDAITQGGATTTVYSGALTALDLADLGTLDKDEARTYRFVVTFPDGGANGADNAYQGSSASIGFEWIIGAAGPSQPPASAPLEQQVAADEPLAYWPLDGSQSAMSDITGLHAGLYANSVTTAGGTAPGGGRAAWFDGRAGYGYVNGLAAPRTAYTVEAWVNPAEVADMTILEHGGGGALTIENGRFVLRHLGSRVTSTATVAAGRWQQVAGSWDAHSNVGRIYVDGQPSGQGSVSGVPSGSSTFFVGRGNSGPGFFHGAMAQVSYYRSSLDAERIAAHWASGRGAATTPPPADPAPAPQADPVAPTPASSGGEPAPSSTGGEAPPATTPTTPEAATCPSAVTAQGGQSSMWAILNARARAKALAKARARARGKARGKARGQVAAKKTKRSTCAGARVKKTAPSG
jgi:hypothetical protein